MTSVRFPMTRLGLTIEGQSVNRSISSDDARHQVYLRLHRLSDPTLYHGWADRDDVGRHYIYLLGDTLAGNREPQVKTGLSIRLDDPVSGRFRESVASFRTVDNSRKTRTLPRSME